MTATDHGLVDRILVRLGFKSVPASEFVIGRFRDTGEPCTLAQARALEQEVGWDLLALVEYFEGEELKASLAMYLEGKQFETRH